MQGKSLTPALALQVAADVVVYCTGFLQTFSIIDPQVGAGQLSCV
jgi:hypothetical protein